MDAPDPHEYDKHPVRLQKVEYPFASQRKFLLPVKHVRPADYSGPQNVGTLHDLDLNALLPDGAFDNNKLLIRLDIFC